MPDKRRVAETYHLSLAHAHAQDRIILTSIQDPFFRRVAAETSSARGGSGASELSRSQHPVDTSALLDYAESVTSTHGILMAELPDLPGLESIEEEIDEGWPCWCCLPVPLVIVGGAVQGYWLYGLIASVVLAALTVVLGRLSKHRIRTDEWELADASPLRAIRIAWAEVTDAATVTTESDEPERYIRVDGPGKRIRVPVTGVDMAALEASVWQHLRRYGKHAGVKLSHDALSLWMPIPDDIPDEMDWEMLRGLDWADQARYSVRRRYILCEFVDREPDTRPTAIDFAAVTSARWEYYDSESLSLVIQSDTDSIYIPFDPEDPASAQLLLAVIRRLRSLNQVKPLAIPSRIRELVGLTLM
ncbi:MAG: hypothetical protein ACP5R5_06945 [Armatimonadota bacterium]